MDWNSNFVAIPFAYMIARPYLRALWIWMGIIVDDGVPF